MNEELVRALEIFVANMKGQIYSQISLSKFITEETYLGGKRFSFAGHEYQRRITEIIEQSFGKQVSIGKSSQLGISELIYRILLAIMATRPGNGIILALPTKTFAQEVVKTRIAAIINESPRLAGLINRDVDSASTKQFINGSILYALGGNKGSSGTLLNRPGAVICGDEIDRISSEILTGFRSRQTHTLPQDRLNLSISTPTVAGVGIDAELEDAYETHTTYVKCEECSHEFIADYYQHVKVPGYTKDLIYFSKSDAANCDIQKAYLECPECKAELDAKNRSVAWKVTFNERGVKSRVGIVLDPFVAKDFISMPDLVEASLSYVSSVEFRNQGLGKVASTADTSISRDHIKIGHDDSPGLPIFGLDMGKQCHYMRGILKFDTTIHVLELQIVNLPDIEEFLRNEIKKHYFACGVFDSQPYSDLTYKFIREHPQIFSAIYVDPAVPKPDLYTLVMSDKYSEEVRQININKNLAMGNLYEDLQHIYTFEPCEHTQTMIKHFLDMRKVRDYEREHMTFRFVKSAKGQDHFWHSFCYLYLASRLAQARVVNHSSTFIGIKKFSTEPKK